MAKSLFWSSDEAWKSLSPHLKRGQPGKPRVDDPTVISGFLHVLKTGCRWRDVPPMGHRQQSLVTAPCPAAHLREDGGRWPHSRRAFNRQQPRQSPSLGEWLKEGEFEEATSRSLGGRTSKIYALADDHGRPVAFALTPGNVADVVTTVPLLGHRKTKPPAGGQGLRRRQSAPPG